MTSYTTSDLSRKSGDIIAEAMRRPVTITQRNKPRLMMLSIEDYERLKKNGDKRRDGTLATMSAAALAEFSEAVESYAKDGDERCEPVKITRHGKRELVLMPAEHYDWLRAAAQRSHRTADAMAVVVDAVERAEMAPERAGLGSALSTIGQEFGGVDLQIERDKTPTDVTSFE